MKTNILNTMKQFAKYFCAVLLVIGTSVSAWGVDKMSIDVTPSVSGVEWTESTTIIQNWITVKAGAAQWGESGGTYFTLTPTSDMLEQTLYAYVEGNATTDDYGITLCKSKSTDGSGVPNDKYTYYETGGGYGDDPDPFYYMGFLSNLSDWHVYIYVTITSPHDSYTTNIVFYIYDGGGNIEEVLRVPVTVNMEGGYTVETAVSPAGKGTVTAQVSGEDRTRVMGNEQLDLDATPISGWLFDHWGASDGTNIIFDDDDAASTYAYLTGNQTITAYFVEDCTVPGVLVYDEGLEYDKEVNYGAITSFSLSVERDGEGAVTWESDDPSVATVSGDASGATVTIVGAGLTDIRANVAKNGIYCAGSETYALLVYAVAPTVVNSAFAVSDITDAGATFTGGKVTANGGTAITQYGYIVGTSSSVEWATRFGSIGWNGAPTLNAEWGSKILESGLSANTNYYVRPFAYNGTAYGYGDAVAFKTRKTSYTVTYAGNGGEGSMTDSSSPYEEGSDVTVLANGFTAPVGKVFDYWAGSDGNNYDPGDVIDDIAANITLTAQWRDVSYSDAKFSCADWTLTGPSGDIVFITSAANKTVRSQEAFHVSGNGLPHSTALTFTTFPLSSKFVIKKADGTVPQTDEYGVVDADVYVFYTPGEGDTSDGLDEFTSLTVSVTGEPRTATIDTKRVIGRHIATDFVIAAKNTTTNKWYALPANMSGTGNPVPVEIAVNDINNPSLAYTASGNIYNLYLSADKEKVQLGMKNNVNDGGKSFALWANNSASSTDIGKNSGLAESSLGDNYKWTLAQTATNIDNAQDAKYTICNLNNAHALKAWFAASGGPKWGLYSSGEATLRLIPASNIPFTEAEVVEWGWNGAILEVNAQGIDATSVVAHLGEATSAAITLNQTGTSVKGTGTKYNYTVNFGEGIDFAAAASNGAMLTLEWKKGETVKAMSNIVVPKIVATSTTMSLLMATDDPWNKADVHVLPGVTLTANAGDFSSNDVVVDRLEIYPGATVKVTKGAQDAGTLKVRTLVLRNGWTRVGTKNYDVARLYVSTDASLAKNANDNVWYSDWYIDYDQYYPIAVPFWVATSSISYKNTKSAATAGVKIRYYDGARRAENGQQNQDDNWVAYTWGSTMPENLEPSKGYAMTAKRPTGKAFSIVRMPMTFTNAWTALGEHGYIGETHKDQVAVLAHGVGDASKPWYTVGWNFIGNPFMATYNGDGDDSGITGKLIIQEGGSVKYATIPNLEFTDYDQLPVATADLKPGSPFFVQVGTGGTLEFSTSKIVPPSAPIRYTTNDETVPEQEAYIRLSHEGGKDQMGLIIGEDYTEAYEPNADLAKMLGEANAVKTYMRYGEMDMAYVAINQTLAKQWIPVTVKIPADGEYTYSLTRSSTVDALEGIYLIDYGNGDKITNLLEETYQFEADAGTLSGRFAINAIFGERPVPTDIDIVGGDINGSEPVKFLYHDKVFILHNGVIYDATGKKVREIK